MNKCGWQMLVGGIVYFAAICFAAWGNGAAEPLPIDVYLLALGIAFAGYFMVCRSVFLTSRNQTSIPVSIARITLLIAIVARLAMFAAPHRFNSDVSRYVWDGYLVTQGINPYQFPPNDAELFEFQSDQRFDLLKPEFNHVGTVYGPVAMTAFAIANQLPGDPKENIRLIMLIGDLLAIGIIALTLRRIGYSDLWLMLYALNPLLIDSFAQRGQMEGLIMPLLAGIFYCFAGRQYLATGLLIAAAAAAKLNMFLLFPIAFAFLIRTERKHAMRLVFGFSIATCVLAIPYLLAGQGSLSGLFTFGANWQANSSFFSLFKITFGDSAARGISITLFAIIFVRIVYTGYYNQTPTVQLAEKTYVCFIGLLLLAPAVFPWYLTWCLPMVPILAANRQHSLFVLPILIWSMAVVCWYFSFLVYEPEVKPHFDWIQSVSKTASEYIAEPWKLFEYIAVFTSIVWVAWKTNWTKSGSTSYLANREHSES